jgi:hypothetical protein
VFCYFHYPAKLPLRPACVFVPRIMKIRVQLVDCDYLMNRICYFLSLCIEMLAPELVSCNVPYTVVHASFSRSTAFWVSCTFGEILTLDLIGAVNFSSKIQFVSSNASSTPSYPYVILMNTCW